MKRVVVVGMGFGGVRAARELAGQGVEVVLVDRNNYHLFQPLLYQVATAGLEQESIAYPIRAMVRGLPRTRFILAEVTAIDLNGKTIETSSGPISYDYLVVGAGSVTNYFGNQELARHAFDLKRLADGEQLRNHVLTSFERAVAETDPEARKALMTFVIVGGGPTGVEFAGALIELVHFVLSKDYPELNAREARIMLVEAADRLLMAFPEKLSTYAVNKLRTMGVEVLFNRKVTSASATAVELDGVTTIATRTLFWSAGVCAAPLAALLGVEQGPGGRIPVQPDLSLKDHPEVFVIGDMAFLKQDGAALPMVAPVAMQMGIHVAKTILAREWGRPVQPFRYHDKGSMATIGRSAAVATTHGLNLRGYPAWLAWLLLHLYYLIGFRNRILVLLNWGWYYWFHERQVRLITDHEG
ncbi:NAD(P)/FAD-dependent oxidoreductase [Geobacter pelophilus]|uniref:NADH:ubiquinone reductase (non-electrogenic) n=1 Tax=Geoanaerobacter pelophilus TaxID=60036 RepID=A0AAW4L8H3_9BACT|nr:NAD(P)/FAD-dependent oxidoreductase [Geoanaerobacter pelophilus]MBT0665333.1 NAD(P)/FAD-dependent oxidoreductase [Geoanaerobacter pelophilus]